MNDVSHWPDSKTDRKVGSKPLPGSTSAQAILSHLPNLIFLIDVEANIRWANRADLIGECFTNFIAPEDRRRLLSALTDEQMASPSEPRIFETLVDQGDETINTIAFSYEKLPNSDLFLISEHQQFDRKFADTLQDLASAVNSTLHLNEVLHLIVTQLRRVLHYDSAALMLLEEDALRYSVLRGYSAEAEAAQERLDFVKLPALHDVIKTYQPVLIADTHTDARWKPISGLEHVRSWLGVPLLARNHLIGVLCVGNAKPHVYSESDVGLVEAFATQVSVAIDNARLFEETQRHAEHMTALNEVITSVSQTLDLEQTLHTALDKALEIVGVEAGAISLIDQQADELVIRVHRGWRHPELADNLHIKLGEGLSGNAVAADEVVITGEVQDDPRLAVPRFGEQGVQAMALVPMHARGRVLGILGVMNYSPYDFSDESIDFLKALADHIGVAIDNARLYEAEYTRRRTSEVLGEISSALASTRDQNQAFNITLQHLADAVPYDRARIVMIEDEHSRICAAHGFGSIETLLQTLTPIHSKSILNRLRREKRPIMVPNTLTYDDWDVNAHGDPEMESWLGAPLIIRQDVVGVIIVEARGAHTYHEEDAVTLFTLAGYLATTVENARLYEQTKRRLDELTTLHEISQAGTSSVDVLEISKRTVDVLQRTFDFDYLAMFRLDAAGTAIELYAASEREEEVARYPRIELGRGITGTAAQTGQAIYVGDVRKDPRYLPTIPSVRSELAVPLKVGDRITGVIDAQSDRLNAFSEDDVRLLLMAASHLAMILARAQHMAEMSTLQEFAEQISASLDLHEVLDSIVLTLKKALGCRGVSLSLLSSDTQMLEIKAAAGIKARWRRDAKLKLGEGISGKVAVAAKSIYVPDTHEDPDFIFFDKVVRSLLCVPLMIQDRVTGTLTVDNAVPDAFTKDDERLLTIAAAQAAVAIDNAQLYEQLRERARKLESAYRELQEADRVKEELVQNVSHELRTPLTFIKGYVELLLEEDMGPINERQRESLSIVAEKTNSVTRLVSDIIFLEQIERESLEISELKMEELAQLALQGCEVTAVAAGIHLQTALEANLPTARGDKDRVNQVFDNLLANAIKFSPNGGTISVSLRQQGGSIVASVSDTGIGIPADRCDRIFERFYQVDGSATRQFGGAGVGLAIVKRIIEAHSGRVWVESKVGVGSTFSFTIPIYHQVAEADKRT